MTKENLIEVMIYHAKNLTDTDIDITKDTIHKDVLNRDVGVTSLQAKRLYKGFIRYTLLINDREDKSWPKSWFDKSLENLATKLLD
ncbi:hypothetical protein [Aquimarina sp. I32.4]|uniref:hypothetical protein n=1 Tax=Aquimarina sp. I32.4 TaxID=2053903 RepID=UPI000CDF082D|nr:hypothetical protein [Aquimarina sp. I32.4]